MAAKTQPQSYMPLSGRRYGSFAGRAEFTPVDDGGGASFLLAQPEHMTRHHFPKSSSHIGARHHHGFSIFPGLRPAGA